MAKVPTIVPPSGWIAVTSLHGTEYPVYVLKTSIVAYGDCPEGWAGNAWLMLHGALERWYVLETMDQLTVLLQ